MNRIAPLVLHRLAALSRGPRRLAALCVVAALALGAGGQAQAASGWTVSTEVNSPFPGTQMGFGTKSSPLHAGHGLGPHVQMPVLVELFSAQGCPSCPAAEHMLANLAARDNVLALSWHVDYWDYLGWADALALPQSTERQEAYNTALGGKGVYTPQMVFGGEISPARVRPAEADAAIKAVSSATPRVSVSVARSKKTGEMRIEMTPVVPIRGELELIVVQYVPHHSAEIERGENRGKHVDYVNVVVGQQMVGTWDGQSPLRLRIAPGATVDETLPKETRDVLIVQHRPRVGNIRALGRVEAVLPLDRRR